MNRQNDKVNISRIALAQIRYRKSSSILIGIAILLTSALIMMIGCCGYGLIRYQRENIRMTQGDFHAAYNRIDSEKYEQLRNHPALEKVGGSQMFAQTEIGDMTGFLYAVDEDFTAMINRFPLTAGQLPVQADEIALSDYFLQQMGYKGVIGEEITLKFRILEKGDYVEERFTVSGITAEPDINQLSGRFPCLLAEQYADSVISPEDRLRAVYFKLRDEQDYNTETIETAIRRLTAELNIDENDLSLNVQYLWFIIAPNTEVIMGIAALIILVMFFSAIVIYNIFHVGIVDRIQEFGKIRAMGAEKSQLKAVVLLEGLVIGGIAVPLGLILGGLLSEIGFNLLFRELQKRSMGELIRFTLWNPFIILFSAAVIFFTIWLSLRKPIRLVTRISSIDAIRHSASAVQTLKRFRSKTDRPVDYRDLSLSRLAFANLVRNKKRTVTTILTMGLSSILFIVTANVGSSITAEDMTSRVMEKGDFLISLDYALQDKTFPENNLFNMQERGLLNDDFVKAVKAVPGVKAVEVRKGTAFRNVTLSEKTGTDYYNVIVALSPEEWEKEQKDVIDGEADYDKLAEQGGMIFTWATENRLQEFGYEIGEPISIVLLNGQKEIPVQRELSAFSDSLRSDFVMPLSGFEQLGLEGNTNFMIFITCESGMAAVAAAGLSELTAQDKAYVMMDYREQYELSEMQIRLILYPIYGLLMALGFIGFMNMANTIITSIMTRKKELGVLQAVGLTNQQMSQMLQIEGLAFTIGTLCLALTAGNGLGYAAFAWARDNYVLEIRNYHFPILEETVFVAVIVLLQFVLSGYYSRMVRKEGIIERVRQ